MRVLQRRRNTLVFVACNGNNLRFVFVIVALCVALIQPAVAQWIGKQTGCYADSMTANPNRPTVANPADITQYGVLELEYGWDRSWLDESVQQTSVGGLLKFGILCDVEFRWNTTSFLSQTGLSGTHQGLGDNWIGTQIRVYRQTRQVPTLAFGYATKIPSASAGDGLGTGQVDHAFTFLASKDIGRFHLDFNLTQFLVGRPLLSGFDMNRQLNLAFSHFLSSRLQLTGEFYGDTRLNQNSPSFASSLWALTYTVVPRLVIDSGFEAGLTAGGPHRHAFVGLTFAVANVYPGWRRRRSGHPADSTRKITDLSF
jgi:Putative MetA-pathway of phenol degradation